jgi:hypothetical protein
VRHMAELASRDDRSEIDATQIVTSDEIVETYDVLENTEYV